MLVYTYIEQRWTNILVERLNRLVYDFLKRFEKLGYNVFRLNSVTDSLTYGHAYSNLLWDVWKIYVVKEFIFEPEIRWKQVDLKKKTVLILGEPAEKIGEGWEFWPKREFLLKLTNHTKRDQNTENWVRTLKRGQNTETGSKHRNGVKTLGSSRLVQIPNFDPKKSPGFPYISEAAVAIKSSVYSLNIFQSSFWSIIIKGRRKDHEKLNCGAHLFTVRWKRINFQKNIRKVSILVFLCRKSISWQVLPSGVAPREAD